MKELSQKLSRYEMILNIVEILAAHALLACWFVFAFSRLPIVPYIILSVIFSLIHQRTVSEWIHEAAHLNILTKRFSNDLFTQVFLGLFFLNDIKKHRHSHMHHHRLSEFFVVGDPDTEVHIVKSRSEFKKGFILDLIGFTAFKMFFSREQKTPDGVKSPAIYFFLVAHLVLFLLFIYIGRVDIYLIYYFTLGLLYPALNRIRVYSQHAQIDVQGTASFSSSSARTISTEICGRIFVCSPLMKYHFEHHRYPQIPFRRLKKLSIVDASDFNQFSKNHWEIIFRFYKGLPEK